MNTNDEIINFKRMIFLPLIIIFISVMIMSILTSFFGMRILKEGTKYYGYDIGKEIVNQIESNTLYMETIDEIVENKINIIEQAIISSNIKLNNDTLKNLSKKYGAYEINYFNKDGEIIYSNIDKYVGFKVYKGHPIEKYMNSKFNMYVEKDIRKDTESSNYLRYGYAKIQDGSFIQIGILSEDILNLKEKFQYQNQLNKLKNNKNIAFAYYYDSKFNKLAAIENSLSYKGIKMDDSFNKALNKTNTMIELKDDVTDKRFLKVTMPVVNNEKVIGILILGITLDNFYAFIGKYIISSFIIAFLLCIIILITLIKKIKQPIESLSKDVNEIDIEKNLDYRLKINKNDNFYGLKTIINNMINKISLYFNELKKSHEEIAVSNEELSASIEQLTATEEELKAQYDELQNYSQKLEELQQKYNIAIKASNSGVWEINLKDMSINISDNILDMLGYESIENNNIHDFLDKILFKEDKEKVIEKFEKYVNGECEYIYSQVRAYDRAGDFRWFLISGKGITDSLGKIKRLYGIFIDTTEIKKKENKIEYMAYHDELTGLPNRTMFTKAIKDVFKNNTEGALMIIDLDNFKNVNDIKGHVYGDELLKRLGDAFKRLSDDKMLFFRFGGDEFLVLIKDENNPKIIEEYAKVILESIKEETIFTVHGINVSACIGIAMYPNDGNTLEELLMKADTAMYRAKYEGKNKIIFFHADMTNDLKEKIDIEGVLNEALNNNGFRLFYQPIIDAKTGEIISFEALLRLKHSNYSPAKFIPVAEETNLIVPIGNFVIKEAARQIDLWRSMGLRIKPISVNVSPKQLNDNSFIDTIKNILEEYKLNPSYIEIEITESIMLENRDDILKKVKILKELGFTIVLDDFGTGYSSLNYLTYLNVDKIKLDKSLSDKFLEKESIKVMESLIMLIQSLDLKVTAEGIEKIEQLQMLKEIGCNYIQGYVFSKPLPGNEIKDLLN